jgi:putative protease
VAEVEVTAGEISEGDEVLVIGTTTGVYEGVIGEMRTDADGRVRTGKKGDVITFPVTSQVRINDKVYKFKKREKLQE